MMNNYFSLNISKRLNIIVPIIRAIKPYMNKAFRPQNRAIFPIAIAKIILITGSTENIIPIWRDERSLFLASGGKNGEIIKSVA